MMRIKLMPILAGAAALSVIATPFAVKANSFYSGQSLVAQAQEQPQKNQGPWAKLNLTDTQKEQMRAIKTETKEKMQSVLTPEQQAKLQAAREQNPEGGKYQNRREVWNSLNLSDDQKAQIERIKQEQNTKIDAILTPEQRQQMEQMRSEWKQRRQEQQNSQ